MRRWRTKGMQVNLVSGCSNSVLKRPRARHNMPDRSPWEKFLERQPASDGSRESSPRKLTRKVLAPVTRLLSKSPYFAFLFRDSYYACCRAPRSERPFDGSFVSEVYSDDTSASSIVIGTLWMSSFFWCIGRIFFWWKEKCLGPG